MLNHYLGKLFGRAWGCPQDENLFEFTMDGLDPKQHAKMLQHLGDCPRCREQVKDYVWVSEGIALCVPQVEPPDGLCDKVKSRIHNDNPESKP